MGRCKECKEKFYYKEILKSLFVNGRITCRKCSVKNEIEIITGFFFMAAIIFVPIILNCILNSLNITGSLSIILYLGYFAIMFLISPLLIKYE